MENRPNVVVVSPGYVQGLFVFGIGMLAGWLMTRPDKTGAAALSTHQFSDLPD
jgi:hypothetical protein